GLIYTGFHRDRHVVESIERDYEQFLVSCDYGTVNPTSMGLWGLFRGKWYRMREYYFDSRKEQRQKTDEEHYESLCALVGGLPIGKVIVDPSAASFMECIRRHRRFRVVAASNKVLDGIREVASHLQQGDLLFCDGCQDAIREFSLYRWDEKAGDDRPMKTDDHAMDDIRYFVRSAFGAGCVGF
ncbi:MAG: PBSX family phage terminase large subunit, partial [Oscillospiraceae bacterium]